MPSSAETLHDRLVAAALDAGFAAAAGVDLAPVLGLDGHAPHPAWVASVAAYDAWLARGDAGEMSYLVRGRDRRADPRLVLPDARSVFCVLAPYPAAPAGETDPARGVRYARYLRGPDYHDGMKAALERTLAAAGVAGKPCVDTSAVLERTWAALAGLGWIGKNSMLIHPRLGSYVLIGVTLLAEPLGRSPRPHADWCGACRRCLDGCPTGAFVGPRSLDSRRCISYWTLEHRGELELDAADRAALGNRVAGCDVCQEVCPFNAKPSRADASAPAPGPDPTTVARWDALDAEDEAAYRARARGTALERVKPAMWRRNLAWVRGN